MHKLFNNVKLDYTDLINIKTYNKHNIIFNEGDYCNNIGLVIKGNVQINTFTYLGNEYNIINLSKDDTFGNTLVFTDYPFYLGDVISINETKIAFINKNNLIYLMQNDINFLNNFLSINSNAHIESQKRIKVLIQKSIRDKILFYLYEEVKGKQSNIIPIKSKINLATFLNIPRPSLSRELIKMKQDNLIDYNRNFIILKKYDL